MATLVLADFADYNSFMAKLFFTFFLTIVYCSQATTNDEIHILHTCDIHGHALDAKGGYLRLSKLIKEQRELLGQERVILIDCGDTVAGDALASIDRGKAALTYLNHMKYDAWILGNHEIDFGIVHMEELIRLCEVPVLSANFLPPKAKNLKVKPWIIIEKSGLKIAIIGLQSPRLRQWFSNSALGDWSLKDMEEVMEENLLQLRQKKPDIIVLATHQGFGNYWKKPFRGLGLIARKFPQISIILAGHTHQNLPGRKINRSFGAQAGKHGEYLGKVSINFNKKTKKILGITGQLLSCEKVFINEKNSPKKLWSDYKRLKRESLAEVGALEKSISFDGRPGKDCHFSQMISNIIIEETEADIVLHGKFRSGKFSKSRITLEELHSFLPYENHLFFLAVSQRELKLILKEQQKWSESFHFQGLHNYRKNSLGEFHWPQGKKPLVLAVNSYVANSGGGKFRYLASLIAEKGRESNIQIRQLFLKFIQKNSAKTD